MLATMRRTRHAMDEILAIDGESTRRSADLNERRSLDMPLEAILGAYERGCGCSLNYIVPLIL